MEKMIKYFGQDAKVVCDEKCHKAWGINSRPKNFLSLKDEDNYEWLTDLETGVAPEDPGTYEGGHAKPRSEEEKMNKWCVRECERCVISKPNEHNKPLALRDFTKRIKNIQ